MPGGWAGSTRRQRLPADWNRKGGTRDRILARDNGICYLCGQPGADRVDHIEQGDDHRDENLGAVHDAVWPHCHRLKSSREGTAARWRVTERRPKPRHPGLTN